MEQNTVLLLIGKTGSGKSATGNIIFNDRVFESVMSSSSVTRFCKSHTGAVNNRRVTLIDTPDFIFSTHTDFDSDSELKKALELCSPGAHVILLLLSLSTFTKQEMDFTAWFEQKFGVEALRFTVVLFTHAGQRHMRTLAEMIRMNPQLSAFINQCRGGFCEMNIKAPANRGQVTELMQKIDRLISENSNSCYTLDMMKETERRREEERERRTEEERGERELRIETEACVRRDKEQDRAKTLEKMESIWKRFRYLFVKQKTLNYVSIFICFAVVSGGVSVLNRDSSHGWIFTKGFFSGGSASTAGVVTGILWRLMSKSQFICSSSHERPSAVRQILLKTAGVVCGLSAGAVIGHFRGGDELPVTVLAGLAGATGAFTAIQ